MIRHEHNDGYEKITITGNLTLNQLAKELAEYYEAVDANSNHLWDMRGVTLEGPMQNLGNVSSMVTELKDLTMTRKVRVSYLAANATVSSVAS